MSGLFPLQCWDMDGLGMPCVRVLPCGFFCRRNYVHLNMYYEELNYQKVEQVIAYDWLSLVSEIGGLAGILLGASVLTFLEFLDFVTGSILCAICDVSHRRRYNAQRKSSFQGNVELTTNWSLEPPPNT
eukprot:scpid86841/ scgid1215/ 